MATSPRKTVKSALRMPDDLHKILKDAAEQNDQSLNAEIVERLRNSQGIDLRLTKLEKQNAEMLRLVKQIHDLLSGE